MAKKAADALETFVPAETFDGYPFDPKGAPVKFVAGQESIPVPSDYVEMLKQKNLVADKSAKGDAPAKGDVSSADAADAG
jgi:hypothetical protein